MKSIASQPDPHVNTHRRFLPKSAYGDKFTSHLRLLYVLISLPDLLLDLSPIMTELKIQFNVELGNIEIRFNNKSLAKGYKNPAGAKCQNSKEGYLVMLPRLEKLGYIRSSDFKHELIFVFQDEQAAEEWTTDLALVVKDGAEVRIKRYWELDKLCDALGLDWNTPVENESEKSKGRDSDIWGARGSHKSNPPRERVFNAKKTVGMYSRRSVGREERKGIIIVDSPRTRTYKRGVDF